MSTAGEWLEWHRGYDDPDSPQARRLATVQRLVAAALDRAPAGEIRVISMCAGDGRDLLGALRAHPRRSDVRARLVDIDAALVQRGRDEEVEFAPIEGSTAAVGANRLVGAPRGFVTGQRLFTFLSKGERASFGAWGQRPR